jgi:hypothetical protein
MILMTPDENNVEDFIRVIHDHMKKSEQEGNYDEAEMARSRVN